MAAAKDQLRLLQVVRGQFQLAGAMRALGNRNGVAQLIGDRDVLVIGASVEALTAAREAAVDSHWGRNWSI